MTAIITREYWGAHYGRGNVTSGVKRHFVVHHDGHDRSRPGMSVDQESAIMRMIEDYHVNGEPGVLGLTRANPRIAYSFVVMQTGRLYEGCGWGRIGAHTQGLNTSAYALFYPLNGARTAPTEDALEAQSWLRNEGVRLGHLSPSHLVSGHQDHGKPTCPGRLLYAAAVIGSRAPTREAVAARPSLRLGKGGAGATPEERAAVRYLQQFLIRTDFLAPRLASGNASDTGNFGPLTEAAVQSLQEVHGKTADGLVGAQTWGLIESLLLRAA